MKTHEMTVVQTFTVTRQHKVFIEAETAMDAIIKSQGADFEVPSFESPDWTDNWQLDAEMVIPAVGPIRVLG